VGSSSFTLKRKVDQGVNELRDPRPITVNDESSSVSCPSVVWKSGPSPADHIGVHTKTIYCPGSTDWIRASVGRQLVKLLP